MHQPMIENIFNDLCLKCGSARVRFSSREKQWDSQALIPRNFCMLAFHSIFAYVFTLARGGWFNWVNHGDRVIVHCPLEKGVAMTVGPPDNTTAPCIDVEIIKTGGACPMDYRCGETFTFRLDNERLRGLEILDSLFPQIFGTDNSAECEATTHLHGSDVKAAISYPIRRK